ncbi:MAG: PAS domain S-box protein [Pseudomonadota bacterium]|nr:MAG: PAS domain S-box protein [Pseudomonadota bacterium]
MAEQAKPRFRFYYTLSATIMLVMVSLLVLWYGRLQYEDFRVYQQVLAKNSVDGVADEIGEFVRDLEQAVVLFIEDEYPLIKHLIAFPEDQEAIASLREELNTHFPNHFAFTIADASGVPLLGNYDLLVNERCETDIQDFVAHGLDYDVYIHPHPQVYHFDIMSPLRAQGGTLGGVFFVSFRTDVLSRLITNGEIHGHDLFLLRKDRPGLIEVASGGARIELKERDGEFFLSDAELGRLEHRAAVGGTRWELVDIPKAGFYPDYLARIVQQSLLIMLLFFAVGGVFLWYIRREEARRAASERALQSAKEHLQHSLDFSDVGMWELDLVTRRIRWSPRAGLIFGASAPVSWEAYLELVDPGDRERMQAAVDKCMRTGNPCQLEHRLVLRDGGRRWVEVSGNIEGDAGLLVGLVRDITERKRAEQDRLEAEKRQNAALVREVHHRLKNNLQGVIGLLNQYVGRYPQSEEVFDRAISQLHSVSLVYGIQCDGAVGEIALPALLRAICRSTSDMTGRQIALNMLDASLDTIVIIPDRAVPLALIMNELVFNAVKHSVRGAVSIELQYEHDCAIVSVRNARASFPLDFDFDQNRGLGTGLALIRSLLPKQGATLTFAADGADVVAQLQLSPPVTRIATGLSTNANADESGAEQLAEAAHPRC